MKHRNPIVAAVCFAAVAGLFMLLKTRCSAEEPVGDGSAGKSVHEAAAAGSETEKEVRKRKMISPPESNDAAIDFFGIVLDENGNPLGDAEISFSTVRSGSFSP
jgi:protocatechuate 3,4-dioxygenase beta subunit